MSLYQLARLKECVAPILVCGLPRGREVPPEELYKAHA